MKYLHYILLLLITLIVFNPVYAGNEDNISNNFLKSSPLSIAKIQLTQQLAERSATNWRHSFLNSDDVKIDANAETYKDKGKAFIRSLVIPGAGQQYLGKKSLAKTFFITEITLWAGYFAFRKYGNWIREDALVYATTHSGAQIDGKPPQFIVDIGNYLNTDEYNDAKQRMRQFDKVYTGGDYYWDWDEEKNRQNFEQMRISGDRALNNSVFVLGAIFANHLLSAIDAVWETHRYNKKISQKSDGQVKLNINSNFLTGEVLLNIQKLF